MTDLTEANALFCAQCLLGSERSDETTRTPITVIPKERYLSREYMSREWNRLWKRCWLLAGPVLDVESVGDYFTFEIGRESIIVVRAASGVRAFFNVCMHRGRQLVEPGRGHAPSFVCPYHRWDWGTDGARRSLPLEPTFHGAAAKQLSEITCEIRAGFVWVCLTPKPEITLDAFLSPLVPLLEAYQFGRYHLRHEITGEVACNWKVATDGNDTYHLRSVHPQLHLLMDDETAKLASMGLHARTIVAMMQPSSSTSQPALDKSTRDALVQLGIDPEPFVSEPMQARRAIQRELRQRELSLGFDFANLCDDQLTDSHSFFIFPNIVLNAFARHAVLIRHRPHATDPERMHLDQFSLDRLPLGVARTARAEREIFSWPRNKSSSEPSVGPVTEQDLRQFVAVQIGLRSESIAGPLFGDLEYLVRRMHENLDAFMTGSE